MAGPRRFARPHTLHGGSSNARRHRSQTFGEHNSNSFDPTPKMQSKSGHSPLKRRGRYIYAAADEANAPSGPLYEIRGDKVYPTNQHPSGRDVVPWYKLKGERAYATRHNPDSDADAISRSQFRIRRNAHRSHNTDTHETE